MDIAELDLETAELLPDRQALGRWSWDSCHGWHSWQHCWNGWQSWQHCWQDNCQDQGWNW